MALIVPFGDHRPQIDPSAFIADSATIIGNVTIKARANIWPGVVIRGDEDSITIGEGVNIQDLTVVHVDEGQPSVLDDYCMVGHGAIVHGRHIGSGTLIGMGAILLSGSDIGENCIIGAGTMITQRKIIPSGSMVYGTPFKIVRFLRQEEIDGVHQDILNYADLGQRFKQLQEQRHKGK